MADIVIRDHRSYIEQKARALGLTEPRPVPSVADLVADRHGSPRPVSASTVLATAGQPPGFGLLVQWNGDDDLAVTGHVVTTDGRGIAVAGVTDADTFEVIDALRTATFSQEKKNEGVAGLVTIVAAGGALSAAAFGDPELAPFITAAGAALAKAFPESKNPGKSRDAYGQISGADDFARQEGGMIVCGPDAQGTYQSGDSDHQSRWIKSSKSRSDDNIPAHCQYAFFVQRDHEKRTLDGDGMVIIAPWDYKFDDNIGTYEISFILRRGDRSIVQ
jgi:hypothetical protein